MYLRWTRFALFQLTSALCITTVGLAAWGLKTGVDLKHEAAATIPGASLNIKDALDAGGAVTAAAGIASILCLVMQVFLLGYFKGFHGEETMKTVRIKEFAFGFAVCLWIGALIPATYICATRSGKITAPGIPDAVIANIVALSGKNLAYNHQTPIIAYVTVGWFAFLSTVINLILVSIAARHLVANPVASETTLAATNDIEDGRPMSGVSSNLEKGPLDAEHHESAHESERTTVPAAI